MTSCTEFPREPCLPGRNSSDDGYKDGQSIAYTDGTGEQCGILPCCFFDAVGETSRLRQRSRLRLGRR